MRRNIMTAILLAGAILAGCSKVEVPRPPEATDPEAGDTTAVQAEVRFDIRIQHPVRTRNQEERIRTLQIFAYNEGKLAAHAGGDGSQAPVLILDKGLEYSFYILANYPDREPAGSESGMSDISSYCISEAGQPGEGLPMAWKSGRVLLGRRDRQTIEADLENLTAGISLRIDRNDLIGFEVTSLQVRNAARTMQPFGHQRSRATNSGDMHDLPAAGPEETRRLNAGETVRFTVLENCQGTLLPENRDPWRKLPGSQPEEDLCTYIDIEGKFRPESLFEGELHLRLYPGTDNCSNFDIRRNTETLMQLCLSGENLDHLSWEVADMAGDADAKAKGKVLRSRNAMSDLYVGQRVDYEVTLEPGLCAPGDRIEGFRVEYVPSAGGDVRIGGMTREGDDRMRFSFTATGPGAGSLVLTGPDGAEMARLEDLYIQQPLLIWSTAPAIGPQEDARKNSSDQYTVTVNSTGEEEIYLYALDRQGHNLNEKDYGYDASAFAFSAVYEGPEEVRERIAINTKIPQEDSSGILGCKVSLTNDGKDPAYNRTLSDCYSSALGSMTVHDRNSSISQKIEMKMDIRPLDIRIIDCSYAEELWPGKYFESGWAMAVVNPSRIPIKADIWHLTTDKDCQDMMKRPSPEDTDNTDRLFDRKETTYITDEYKGSGFSIPGGRKEVTDHIYSHDEHLESTYVDSMRKLVLEFGDTLVHPIRQISSTTAGMLTMAESRETDTMHHIIDITLNGETLRRDDLDAACRHISYFTCGKEPDYTIYESHTGIHCYSNGSGPEKDWKGLTPSKLTSLTHDVYRTTIIKLWYNEATHQMLLYTVGGNPYGLTVDARVTAEVESECRDKQGHNAPHIWPVQVCIEKKGIKLSDQETDIDPEESFYKAMKSVSRVEYRWSTFKKQYTYPTAVSRFTLELKLSGKDHRAYPIKIRYGNTTSFPFRHWSEKNDRRWYYPPGVPGQWNERAQGYRPESAGLYTLIDWEYKKQN